ncbi:hypothetical protein P154DRAFT_418271, partial [Amniculicola lignicola CBS 123094]
AIADPGPQIYTGPCTTTDCGGWGVTCKRGYMCVGWPSVDPAKRQGCACSY